MHQFILLIISLLTLSLTPPSSQQQCSNPAGAPVRAGYWLPQSNHYSPPSLINTSLFTHLYYSLPLDQTNSPSPLLANFSTTLKPTNSTLKTILSITTDTSHADASNAAFSSIATDHSLRAAFIDSTLQLARANAFDGLDLSWQFPSSSPDMANLAILLAEWRAKINNEAPTLLLTATVYFSNHIFDGANGEVYYPIDAITRNLDWVNALCFGYQKAGDVTSADAALHNKVSHFSTNYGITSWLNVGVPACKLVMGMPLYGRSWFLKNKAKNGVGAPVVAAGPKQRLSNQTGIMAYFEIEDLLKDPSSVSAFDNATVAAYFHNGGLWVSFDGPEVVQQKIEFAVRNKLLGYLLWPISFDDSNYTVSKQAMGVWLRDQASGAEDEIGFEEALSPFKLPPQDEASTPSGAIPGQRLRSFSITNNFHLHSCLLFLLLI